MSSRQEEKERRRREREAAEAAAARSQSRKARMRLGLGALIAIAVIVVAVLVLSGSKSGSSDAKSATNAANVALPPLQDKNLQSAAKAAGCTLKTYPQEGREHTTAKVAYKTNPPTSGNHNPTPAQDGLYDPGNSPEVGMTVHSLEHGRIEIQYKKGTPTKTVDALEALGSEKLGFGTNGYHVLVFQNQTNMPSAVAATAWTQSLTCPAMNTKVYDAVRDFRTAYTDKGPELIP